MIKVDMTRGLKLSMINQIGEIVTKCNSENSTIIGVHLKTPCGNEIILNRDQWEFVANVAFLYGVATKDRVWEVGNYEN